MAEDIKSALHDATPSWNGFIYQGKVGLYVCLKIILDKLQTSPTDEAFTRFLDLYSIEYEWIEDFSIKVNNVYESLHQVKHKAGTAFSSHISAIVTILNRKQKILSETDFNKYIKFDIADKDELLAKIHTTFDLMTASGYINEHKQLEDNWQVIEEDINHVDSVDLKKLLTEFQDFSENAFDNSKVYFHTSEAVTLPQQDMNLYAGIPDSHKGSVNGLRTLSTLDIYLGFDAQQDYELALSDQLIEQKLLNLIHEILLKVQSAEEYLDDDKKMFLAALYEILDQHIVSRHKNIRASNIQGEGFLEQREQLNFSQLFDVLRLKLRNTNEKYWELFCRQNFEQAFIDHIDSIQLRIDRNQNKAQSEVHLERLQQFRTDVLSKYSKKFTSLLRLLFPHKVQKNLSNNAFYSSLTEKSKIMEVFLFFIQKVDEDQKELLHKHSHSLAYHPTCIDISHGDEFSWENNIEQCRYAIAENEYLRDYFGATHIVIQANQAHDISNVDVDLQTIVDQIDMDKTDNIENKINNFSKLKFEKVDTAIEVLNGN